MITWMDELHYRKSLLPQQQVDCTLCDMLAALVNSVEATMSSSILNKCVPRPHAASGFINDQSSTAPVSGDEEEGATPHRCKVLSSNHP